MVVRKLLLTVLGHLNGNIAHRTDLDSHQRAEVLAVRNVQLALVTNKCGAETDYTASEQQKASLQTVAFFH